MPAAEKLAKRLGSKPKSTRSNTAGQETLSFNVRPSLGFGNKAEPPPEISTSKISDWESDSILSVMACAPSTASSSVLLHGKECAADTDDSENENDEIRWTLMPSENGEVRVAVLSALDPPGFGSESDVYFLLWTRENPFMAERQILNGSCLPKFKYFDRNRPTKVMVHGFGDTAKESIMFPLMKDAFLASGDYNIIAVDWAKLAAAPWYHVAARNTEIAAKQTAALIDFQVQNVGARIEDFHLIGFSLGAHVVGITGQSVTTGRIFHITGLDPAQVLYQSVPNSLRLDQSDAELVEVIHTSGGYLAFIDQIGHRDFFPNGGFWPQPGCVFDFVAVCSHQRAYYYLAEAIKRGKGFKSTSCQDWASYKTGMCESNEMVPLWNHLNNSVTGKFFLDTNKEEPFSKD